jgi:hypothetical protein
MSMEPRERELRVLELLHLRYESQPSDSFKDIPALESDGFDTGVVFNSELLRRYSMVGQAFYVEQDGRKYGAIIMPSYASNVQSYHAIILADQRGDLMGRESWRKITLVKGDDGQIVVRPDWVR